MRNLKNMARKLPEYTIGGNVFTVDGRIYEFREKAAPWNKISMDDFWEEAPTHILFDKQTRKIYTGEFNVADRPAFVELIVIPPIIELDPIGLARHYNMADDVFIPKERRKQVLSEQLIGLQQNEKKHIKGRRIK
jgi:hypothetical protein